MDLTSKAIFYFSLTGNTKAILDNVSGFDIYDIETATNEFENYDVIVIGLPSYGRGQPHEKTWNFLRRIMQVKGKKIALYGSGQTIYRESYGGAIDGMENILKANNDILFKFKFESYPTQEARAKFESLMNRIGEM